MGAILFGGGMVVGSLGVHLHNLLLLYGGWGIAGAGLAFAYLPPIALLMRWFPDKKGLASGMAIAGFGGGALLIVNIKKRLLKHNFKAPQYVGTLDDMITKRDNEGKLLCNINNDWSEVINVTNNDLSRLTNIDTDTLESLNEGLYLVNSGSTGVMMAMGSLGTAYLCTILFCALNYKEPNPSHVNKFNTGKNDIKETHYVSVDDVMKTPQFWLAGLTLSSTATVGS